METITRRLKERREHPGEGGFSLIELMIVLLIIAILLAVAIPTYLAARNRAENRAAQESIQHVFVAAKSSYASQNSYSSYPGGYTHLAAYLNADGAGAKVILPSSGNAILKTNEIGEEHTAQALALGAWAPDGKCWYLLDIESPASRMLSTSTVSGPGIYYGTGKVSPNVGCDPTYAPPASGWTTSFAAASAAGSTTSGTT